MKKICTKCKENKPLEDFYIQSRNKDSRRPSCKTCDNKICKKYRENSKEERKQYKNNNREKIKKQKKVYRKKNIERILKYEEQYRIENKEKIKNYYKTEQGKLLRKKIKHKRRAGELTTINDLTIKEKNIIFSLQSYKCISCNEYFDKVEPTLDHIIPVVNGGGFTKNNIQILCQRCNSSKSIKIIDYRSKIHKQLITNLNYG